MKTRVYYGQYSLKHWINLMLKENIVLPEYQRRFVWGEKDTKRLIKSFQEGQFVQPITIAQYKVGNTEQNLILDGQQRLTSILLYYLGYFPDKNKFDPFEETATTSDDSVDEDETTNDKKIIGWTFEDLLDKNKTNTIETIKEKLKGDDKYKEITKVKIKENDTEKDLILDDTFWDTTFLGFSYIIPTEINEDKTKRYFSTLFRHMNYFGQKLLPIESRRSLYYLNKDYKNYFDGIAIIDNEEIDVFAKFKIMIDKKYYKIDIVRYTSILSQYVAKGEDIKKILVGYSAYSSRENYYADYVSFILEEELEERTDKFNGFEFDEYDWKNAYKTIYNFIQENYTKFTNDNNKTFNSWIESDYWLCGLIFWVLFKKQRIKEGDKEELFKEIKEQIEKAKNKYSKTPNQLGNLRERMKDSIEIYSRYVQE